MRELQSNAENGLLKLRTVDKELCPEENMNCAAEYLHSPARSQ